MSEDEEIRITLRMPEELRDRLKTLADESGRSMNAEIVARLEESTSGEGDQEWKRRFEEEREAFRRMERLYDGSFDVAMNYRTILATARGQLLQYVGMVKSLASIITNLEGPPAADVIDVAERLEAAATETRERLSQETPLNQAKNELKKLEGLIAKADELRKKD